MSDNDATPARGDVEWADTLRHHASHPDPISLHCAIPARMVEEVATHIATLTAERDALAQRVRELETWLRGGIDNPECDDRWICAPRGAAGPVVARDYNPGADIVAPSLLELADALRATPTP